MRRKTRTFDFVETKRQAQEKPRREDEVRKDELPTLLAFLRVRCEQAPWSREVWRGLGARSNGAERK